MNKNIELVKKWLDDSSSVTRDELLVNSTSAAFAYHDDDNAANGFVADAAYFAYRDNAYFAYRDNADAVAYWVKRYEELSE